MKYCTNCGNKLEPTDEFCTKCGTPVAVPKKHQDDDKAKLAREVTQLKQQMREQQRNNSVNVLARLAVTRPHMMQVLRFMEDNALTLFICCLIMLLPWGSNIVRVILFLIYLIAIYCYPLLSTKERFAWDEALETWLNDKDNLKRIRVSAQQAATRVKNEVSQQQQVFAARQKQRQAVQAAQTAQQAQATATAAQSQAQPSVAPSRMVINAELIIGVLATVIGGFLYVNGKSEATNLASQFFSVVKNAGLNGGGYMYIWGAVVGGCGILAVIGGLLRMLLRRGDAGDALKIIAVLLAVVVGALMTYVYMHPIDAAMQAYQSGVSFSDIKTLVNIAKFIPWGVIGLYAIGILINIGSNE